MVEPSVEFIDAPQNLGKIIERAARTCYKSEDKIKEGSDERLYNQIVKQTHHDSVAEHGVIVLQVTTDRAILAQLTRHRHFSFSVESQRYVNYSKTKFGSEIKCIVPDGIVLDSPEFFVWYTAMEHAEDYYFEMIDAKCKPEVARSVLPNSTAVELTMSGNIRQFRHYFKLRAEGHAQSDHQKLAKMMYDCMMENGVPSYLFDDIMK